MAPVSLLWIILVQFCTTLASYKCNAITLSNIPAVLVFGDSAVDTGNNNYIPTIFTANFAPYGMNYPGHIPTGRYSDGKLLPDMLASFQGLKDTVPPFLQPNLPDEELPTGVCFASAGAGLDDQTTVASNAIPMSKQPQLFREYIVRLKSIVGEQEAQRIVREALVMIHAGTVDMIYNFYVVSSNRKIEYTVSGYQDFLQYNHVLIYTIFQELYDLGCRKIIVSGLPPIGCMPLVMSTNSPLPRRCSENINSESQLYNEKLAKLLPQVQAKLPGSKILYADTYNPLMDMIRYPKKYGFVETARGCCGTGYLEVNQLCNPLTPVCRNQSQYVFWDSIHPTEAGYSYLSDYLLKKLGSSLAE